MFFGGFVELNKKLEVDIITKECKKQIHYARPGFSYKIDWNNS